MQLLLLFRQIILFEKKIEVSKGNHVIIYIHLVKLACMGLITLGEILNV